LWGTPLPPQLASSDAGIDTILAADVVYEPECFAALVQTLVALTSSNTRSTQVLLSYRPRHPDGQQFFDAVAEHFSVEVLSRPDPDVMSNVVIYRFVRKVL
jgi:hypothetical protein